MHTASCQTLLLTHGYVQVSEAAWQLVAASCQGLEQFWVSDLHMHRRCSTMFGTEPVKYSTS